jgi:hypothetical protein
MSRQTVKYVSMLFYEGCIPHATVFSLFSYNLNDIPDLTSGKALSRTDESATNEKNEYPKSLILAQLVNGRQGSYPSDVQERVLKISSLAAMLFSDPRGPSCEVTRGCGIVYPMDCANLREGSRICKRKHRSTLHYQNYIPAARHHSGVE